MGQVRVLVLGLLVGVSAQAQVDSVATGLPVTRVSLYKNGVGFFEHAGRVVGSQTVTIDFTTAQLNDVLQTLTAIDLGGGRVVGAGYNSTTPLEQQLKAMPLALGEDPTSVDFYNAIRGARVEVRSGAVTAAGRLLKVEVVYTGATSGQLGSERRLITVVSEAGEVRTMEVTPATSVRLVDGDLDRDVTRYLQLLASTRNQGLRHLTLLDNAPAAAGAAASEGRQLHVSYLSEVPVWKSTYRILFTDTKAGAATTPTQQATLQGWSVVDNKTGEDWNHVQLSLIAGAPQSFIQPISQPIYSRRPEIAIAQTAQLTPQTHESGEMDGKEVAGSGIRGTVTDASGAVIPNATVTAINTPTNARTIRTSNGLGEFVISPLPAGRYTVSVTAPGFQTLQQQNVVVNGVQMAGLEAKLMVGAMSETVTVTASPMMLESQSASVAMTGRNLSRLRKSEQAKMSDDAGSFVADYDALAQASIVPNATGAAFDDYFAYNLTEPITIRKNESALVPILQTKVDSERVTLWSPQEPTPLRALWVTNTSDLTLDRGSFTIIENGSFGGEGLLDAIHPKEKRLLSYAVDQAVRVTAEGSPAVEHVTSIAAAKGVVVVRKTQSVEVTYAVRNAAPEARTVVVEHPVRAGYVLDASLKPEETTPAAYRFRVAAAAGETVRLKVAETLPGSTEYKLEDADEDDFALILKESGNNPALEALIQPVLAARRKAADAEDAVTEVNGRIEGLRVDEERQRSNVTAIGAADKSSRERFVRDLNATEDKIASAQKELTSAQAGLKSAEGELAKKIEAVQFEGKM